MKIKISIPFLFFIFILNFICLSASLKDLERNYLLGDYSLLRENKNLFDNERALYLYSLSLLNQGDYLTARKYLKIFIKKFPSSSLYQAALVKFCDTYFLNEEYEKAKKLYLNVLKKYPTSNYLPLLYLRLVQVSLKLGDWQDKDTYISILERRFRHSIEYELVKELKKYPNAFTVQVGAFTERKNAFSLRKELQDKFPAYIVSQKTKDNIVFYKVRIGKYKKRKTALLVKKRLLALGYPALIYP